MNTSTEQPSGRIVFVHTVPPEYRFCGGVLTSLISLAVFFGNGVLIGAVISQKQLRKLQNIYIALLASTDILLLLSVKLTAIYTYFIGKWIFDETYCLFTYCLSGYYQLVLLFCTFLLMCNRAHLIASPWWAACMGKKNVVIMITIGSIVTSILCGFYLFFQPLPPDAAHFEVDVMACVPLYNKFPVLAYIAVVLVTIATQTGIYVYLWQAVVKCRRRIESREFSNGPMEMAVTCLATPLSQRTKREIILARTTLLTIIWCKSKGLAVPFGVSFGAVMLFWLRYNINWITFGVMNSRFRNAYWKIVACLFRIK